MNSISRSALILLADAVIAALALWAAFVLRFDQPQEYFADLPNLALALVIVRLLANLYFRLDRWSFKFSSLRDGARVVLAGFVGTVGFVLVAYFGLRSWNLDVPPRGVVVVEMLLSIVMMAGVRFAPRLVWLYRADLWRWRSGARTLIAGAGTSGELLLRSLTRSDEDSQHHVVGFVDDDRSRWGHIVGGKPILGGLEQLPNLARSLRVQEVVIAMPRLPASRLRQILSMSFAEQVRFRILPVGYGNLRDSDLAEALRDVSTDDLLSREPLTFEPDERTSPNGDKVQMVTGGAGSIGSEVCAQLLGLGSRRLVMVDTDENGLYVLKRRLERRFPAAQVVAEVADIRDVPRIGQLFSQHRPSDIFHAAARKHVPLMEAAPGEAVKTNVLGTANVARLADTFGADRFVYMSTDKAVRPTSVMGATKRLGEQVVRAMAEESSTQFSVVRFGNVLDSAGSVVPLFREQIAAGGPVTVTHPEIQRFFMTISEAVGLVLRAAYGGYGNLCVLEMGEPIRIVDLARQMITMAGRLPDIDIPIEFSGLRPGEKLFEELLSEGETVEQVIDKKIRVVRATAMERSQLDNFLQQLQIAAGAEDAAEILDILRQSVPDFRVRPLTRDLSMDDSTAQRVVM